MKRGAALLIATIVALIVAIVVAVVMYKFTGWTPFSFKDGDTVSWTPATGDISHLRFADCVFTSRNAAGTSQSRDVTAVLNGMAGAYAGATGAGMPPSLVLTRPLNPFSFVIPGFNDSTTVKNPSAIEWCSVPPPACTADSQCPTVVHGACSCSGAGGVCPPGTAGVCYSCSGGASATLTGKWRTL